MGAVERTGWRDEGISRRHRKWGFNCPATDMDFLLMEFNHGLPVAVVDYKHHAKTDPLGDLHDSAITALGGLYDKHGANLPLFITRYWPETWAMKALPLNDAAAVWLPRDTWTAMSECRWVQGLYRLREIALDKRDHAYLNKLNRIIPPSEDPEPRATR